MKTLRTLIVTTVVIATIACIGISPVTAQAPGEPVNFYGEAVDQDGNEAPVGTTIVAVVDNEVEGEVVVGTAGQYGEEGAFGKKLALDSNAGETVSFHIDDPAGAEAVDGSRDLTAGTFEVDLTFPVGTFEDEPAVESISIELSDSTMTADEETDVTVTSTLDDGSTEEVTGEAEVESDDISIATVDGNGIVGEGSGTTTIEATYAGNTVTTEITVEESETDNESDDDTEDTGSDDSSDDSNSGNGGGAGTGENTDDESESTDDDAGDDDAAGSDVTVEDVSNTVSESESDTETEINLDEVANDETDNEDDEGGVTVDTSEETESVQEISFQDENVEGTVTVEEYSDSEVTDTAAESIEQTLAADVGEDIQDGEESEDTEEAEGDESGSADDTSEATTGGTTTSSVSVVTVASISVDNPDTAATVTMSVDTDEITNPESATIFHETEDGWEELPTEVEDEGGEEITLAGDTDGFSLFAVAEVTEETDDETTEESEGQTDDEAVEESEGQTDDEAVEESEGQTDDGIPGFGITVAITALISMSLIARRNQ